MTLPESTHDWRTTEKANCGGMICSRCGISLRAYQSHWWACGEGYEHGPRAISREPKWNAGHTNYQRVEEL